MSAAWPDIPYEVWRETCSALHLYLQIVGKYRLARTPWVNHSWHATFYVNARGFTTSLVPDGPDAIEIVFDLLDHTVSGGATDGRRAEFPLGPMSVADFHGRFLEIGKRDIYQNSQLGLGPFRKNLSYFAIDLVRMFDERPAFCSSLVNCCVVSACVANICCCCSVPVGVVVVVVVVAVVADAKFIDGAITKINARAIAAKPYIVFFSFIPLNISVLD